MAEPGPSRSQLPSVPDLEVEVARLEQGWDAAGVDDAMLEDAARATLAAAEPVSGAAYDVSVALADDAEMRRLNCTWRGKDAPTNVLSFPDGAELGGRRHLGDVVLALETVRREAAEQGVAVADHVCHLVVHGVLHLLGHDHGNDQEAEKMEQLEAEILATLGVANPYTDAPCIGVTEPQP